jgi:hypothetical protein
VLDSVTLTDDKKASLPYAFRQQLIIEQFPEFGPAKAEVRYQSRYRKVYQQLKQVTDAYDVDSLQRLLTQAEESNMKPKFNRTSRRRKFSCRKLRLSR